MRKERSYTEQISDIYPQIIGNLLKQQASKSVKVRIGVMKTLSVLACILHQNLEEHLELIFPFIESSIRENNNDLITYSLNIMKYAFKNSDPLELS